MTVDLGPCREYQGSRGRGGYGQRYVKGRKNPQRVTRWVMEQVLGRELLPNEQVLHHCDNPPCFRFDHLWIGTHADNMADRNRKGRQARGDRHGTRTHPIYGPPAPPKKYPGSNPSYDKNAARKRRAAVGPKLGPPAPRPYARGDRLPHTKLTPDGVREVRRLIAAGQTKASIAREFGVSRVSINQIDYGVSWGWVE